MNTIPEPKYEENSKVRLRHSHNELGIVQGKPLLSTEGWQYRIFFSANDERFVSEADLIPAGSFSSFHFGIVSLSSVGEHDGSQKFFNSPQVIGQSGSHGG